MTRTPGRAAVGLLILLTVAPPPLETRGEASAGQAQPPPSTVRRASAGQAQTPTPPPKGQMPELGRPTKPDDQLPLFNFDEYFPGKWTFEWDVPEGPLGPAGRITGTTLYKPVDGRFYE